MRVLAASFADRDAAVRVLEELRQRFDLTPEDAAVAPLGVGTASGPASTVLAGRFYEERIDVVRELVERSGGEVVVVVDEVITLPRVRGGNAAQHGPGSGVLATRGTDPSHQQRRN